MSIQKEDRRVRKTRKILKQSMAELMQEKDFKDITVKDITERADLNRGTFYLHYTDTYDLLEKIENEVLEDFQSMIDMFMPKTSAETLLPIIEPIAEYIIENEVICRVLFENKASFDFLNKFGDLVFTNGEIFVNQRFKNVNRANYEFFFSFIIYGLIGVIKRWFENDMKTSKGELVILADKLVSAAAMSIMVTK